MLHWIWVCCFKGLLFPLSLSLILTLALWHVSGQWTFGTVAQYLCIAYLSVCLCVQSVLNLHNEMLAEGRLQSEVVGAALPAHRHESVTTASQTDLSGEVNDRAMSLVL